MTDLVLILTTVPVGDVGEAIARTLIDERLAACVNLCPPMTSFYRWSGAIEKDDERQLIIKTTEQHVAAVQQRVRVLHPYDLPEWLVVPVRDSSPEYAEWIRAETAGPGSERTR